MGKSIDLLFIIYNTLNKKEKGQKFFPFSLALIIFCYND